MTEPERPADLPKHWDPHYQPTREELEEPITLESDPSPDDLLGALLNPTRQPMLSDNTGKAPVLIAMGGWS